MRATFAVIAAAILILTGCTQAQLQLAAQSAGAAVTIATGIDPAISPDVATACAAAQATIATAAPIAKGGAAQTVADAENLVTASCSKPEAQAKLTANDTAPVTITNSGNSPAWLADLAQAVQIAVQVAPLL